MRSRGLPTVSSVVTRPKRPHRVHILALAASLALIVAGCTTVAAPPAAVPTPTPEITVPPLGGSGVITFGTAYNADTLYIDQPLTRFKVASRKIAWSASFSEAAGATTLTFVFASKSSAGVERILVKHDTDVADPAFDLIANDADLSLLAGRKAGGYVLRYLRGSTVLAEGEFSLVK